MLNKKYNDVVPVSLNDGAFMSQKHCRLVEVLRSLLRTVTTRYLPCGITLLKPGRHFWY
jgi:hypothetical protein